MLQLLPGTNAVRLNATHFLAFGHAAHSVKPFRVYGQFAYLFASAPPFCVEAATPEFHLRPPYFAEGRFDDAVDGGFLPVPKATVGGGGKRFGNLGIQFPMSLSTDGDARAPTLQLSWGRGDRDTFLSVLRADWLCARMVVLERG